MDDNHKIYHRRSIRLKGYDYSQAGLYFVTIVAQNHEYIRGVKTKNWQRFDEKLWQRNYWEHIIRNENEFSRISEYIKNNPLKWKNDKLNGSSGNIVMENHFHGIIEITNAHAKIPDDHVGTSLRGRPVF
jgi:hypothetical protein